MTEGPGPRDPDRGTRDRGTQDQGLIASTPRIVAIICVAEILGMTPFSMFLALQPQLREAWHLSNTATGCISGSYFAGYMVAVPVLVSLTDHYDPRSIWLGSTVLAAAAAWGSEPPQAGCGARCCSSSWPGRAWPARTCRA